MIEPRKSNLFAPGSDITPQEYARRKRREAESKQTAPQEWRQHWTPLEPSAPRQVRAGSLDFMACPSVISGQRRDAK